MGMSKAERMIMAMRIMRDVCKATDRCEKEVCPLWRYCGVQKSPDTWDIPLIQKEYAT